MAKVGFEIEGVKNYGLKTLFVDHSEFSSSQNEIKEFLSTNMDVEQIYICDWDGELDWELVDLALEDLYIIVTIETCVINQEIPHNVGIMLNLSNGTNTQYLDALRRTDEVKVATGLDVYSWSMENRVRTYPFQFEDDVEVIL